jgi:ArsR family transcriptional regulator
VLRPEACCQLADPGMGAEDANRVAERFRALADPTRVRILNLLIRNGELCVCDLGVYFDLSQPTLSHHLAVLRRAGLIAGEVRGRWCYYRARPEAIADLRRILQVTPEGRHLERIAPETGRPRPERR